jgi:hypothetical protein
MAMHGYPNKARRSAVALVRVRAPITFGRPASQRPRRAPHEFPASQVRARIFCTDHADWKLVGVVVDELVAPGERKKSALVPTDEDVPYPTTTREAAATCSDCSALDSRLGRRDVGMERLRVVVEQARPRIKKIGVVTVSRRVFEPSSG